MAEQRDRRGDGRPEQARPRDRTGRPLPYGTDVTPLVEEHDPATLGEALATGVRLWGERRYFEAHECLEHVWHQSPRDDRDFWKGVIQVAVGAVHVQRDNPDGATALWVRAADHMAGAPDHHHGIDVARLRATARADAAAVAAGGVAAVRLPTLPTLPGGAFVGAAPDAPDEPVDRTPPWAPREGPAAP